MKNLTKIEPKRDTDAMGLEGPPFCPGQRYAAPLVQSTPANGFRGKRPGDIVSSTAQIADTEREPNKYSVKYVQQNTKGYNIKH